MVGILAMAVSLLMCAGSVPPARIGETRADGKLRHARPRHWHGKDTQPCGIRPEVVIDWGRVVREG
jgi:hypothetical protein